MEIATLVCKCFPGLPGPKSMNLCSIETVARIIDTCYDSFTFLSLQSISVYDCHCMYSYYNRIIVVPVE